ncbi:MAG TPA: SPFH domain-containing protein [Rhizomicrobium sp.]|jgi:regulator of protease activity HflC (stomatin/prohibitin superfamily)|nr:SPFH domain-containing protein [Rhizomicrobium sp.]
MNEMSPNDIALKEADMREVGPWGQAAALSFRFLLLAAIGIAFFWLASNIRQVPADSQAIVIRLGVVERVQGPGLLLALPRPVEQVVLVPASARQTQFTIDRFIDSEPPNNFTATDGFTLSVMPRLNGGFLLTGDSSVVHLEAQIFYQITDPVAYMISVDHVGPALQRLFVASTVGMLAARDLDTVLVARPEIASQNTEAMRRELLRTDLMNAVNRRLEALAEQGAGLGIKVSRVDLVPSIPSGAKGAFDSVLAVSQEADQNVAMARTTAQITLQQSQSNRDHITTDATARAEEAVSAATVATASITALGKSMQDMSHGMQMSRLYYDRIGPILQKAGRVETIGRDGSVRLLLPAAPTGRSTTGATP